MLRILLSSFLASSLLSAVTIDELVKNSFEKNYDLRSLNKSIQVANEQIKEPPTGNENEAEPQNLAETIRRQHGAWGLWPAFAGPKHRRAGDRL